MCSLWESPHRSITWPPHNSSNFPRCQYPAPRADAARETGRRAHPQAAFRAAQRTRRRQRRFHLPGSGVSHSARYSSSLPHARQQRVVRPSRVCGHVRRAWRQPSNHASRRIMSLCLRRRPADRLAPEICALRRNRYSLWLGGESDAWRKSVCRTSAHRIALPTCAHTPDPIASYREGTGPSRI